MIWTFLIISFGLASARDIDDVEPEYLDELRASGQDEKFAKLIGINISLVRPDNSEQRSEGSIFNHVSHLGDILLTEEQERQGINTDNYPNSLWPNGLIYYAIETRAFNSEQLQIIKNAVNDFNARTNKVKLVKRRRQRNYVYIFSGNGCWSYIGKRGGSQALSLQRNGCVSSGSVQHEFLHAAGMAHEHNRSDRDNYVTVLWENISSTWQSQYQKVNDVDFKLIGNYDYYSVMHYPIWAPETFKDAFKIPDGIDRNRLGPDDGITNEDVAKVDALYS